MGLNTNAVEEQTETSVEGSQKILQKQSPLLQEEVKSWWVVRIMGPLENFCLNQNISPNMITMVATLVCVGCFFLYAQGHFLSAGWLVLLAGSLDFLDGRVARAANRVTSQGAFLDSVMDRYQDFLLFSGLAIFYKDSWLFYLVLLALAGTTFVPYVRAKADSLKVDLSNIGFMQRPERFFLLGFGSIVSSVFQISLMPFYGAEKVPPHHVLIAVMFVLAISTHWTAVKRILYSMKSLQERK